VEPSYRFSTLSEDAWLSDKRVAFRLVSSWRPAVRAEHNNRLRGSPFFIFIERLHPVRFAPAKAAAPVVRNPALVKSIMQRLMLLPV
jgi:hypothetical protein